MNPEVFVRHRIHIMCRCCLLSVSLSFVFQFFFSSNKGVYVECVYRSGPIENNWKKLIENVWYGKVLMCRIYFLNLYQVPYFTILHIGLLELIYRLLVSKGFQKIDYFF